MLDRMLGPGEIFTLFFVTLGPLKLLGPFAQLTREADEPAVRKIALLAFALGTAAALLGGFGGRALLHGWHVEIPVMLLTGGIIFFLVGLNLVLEQYRTVQTPPPALSGAPLAVALRVTFPLVATPYGIAALIVLLAHSHAAERTASILAIVIGVMVLNLLAMLLARRIMARGFAVLVLQVLGAVLGVLQVALAIQMILRALRDLGLRV